MLNKLKKTKPEEKVEVLTESEYLAKTFRDNDSIKGGRNVFEHCLIVGEIAKELINRMPEWFNSFFPKGTSLVVALHDVGKISPTFQKKIHQNLTHQNEQVLKKLESVNPDLESNWGGHATVSELTLSKIKAGKFIPEIAGRHHGYLYETIGKTGDSPSFGGEEWFLERSEMIEKIKARLSETFPLIENRHQSDLIAGLTTVSDWIGSGYLFNDPHTSWESKIKTAVDNSGYIKPNIIKNLSFEDIFGFKPREEQIKLIEMVDRNGVYVLEAPMGVGKTEASLYAAYQLLEKDLATGIYFALPTQLTSEKIHSRLSLFLEKILHEDSYHSTPLLIHGSSHLKQIMGEDAATGGSWFSQGKKGILAPFSAGTLDQALLSVLNVKHGFVRTFGLAGKVVILDEVHTYDAYTGTVLDELVDSLVKTGCTVIILSATLTKEKRSELIKSRTNNEAYPLITGKKDGVLTEQEITPKNISNVKITVENNDYKALSEAIKRANEGQQILWIENTVAEAQEIFKMIKSMNQTIEVGLIHSRFTKADRQSNEDYWVDLFGKNGWGKRNQGRILIGTQVLEQSIDIDSDFLVSRIAPIDMILQRLGRLWRHEISNRNENARQEAWILSPGLTEAIKDEKKFSKTAKVYAPYVLLKTLKVLENMQNITLPTDIRGLIESVYDSTHDDKAYQPYLKTLNDKKTRLRNFALQGLSSVNKTMPEEAVQTRFSDIETMDVLLVKKIEFNVTDERQNKGTILTLLNGKKIFLPLNGRLLKKNLIKTISELSLQIVKMPSYQIEKTKRQTYHNLLWLKDYFYIGKEDDLVAPLLVCIVNDDDSILLCHNKEITDINYNVFLGIFK